MLVELKVQITGFLPYLSLRLPQKVLLSIMPRKTTVVTIACWYLLIPQSQCSAGPRTDKIVISIESDIQHSPTKSESFTWNHPKPSALTACATVKVSAKIKFKYRLMTRGSRMSHYHHRGRLTRLPAQTQVQLSGYY